MGVWDGDYRGVCHDFEMLFGFQMHMKQLKEKKSMTRRTVGKVVFKATRAFWLPGEVVEFARKSPGLNRMAVSEISCRMFDKSLFHASVSSYVKWGGDCLPLSNYCAYGCKCLEN